MPHFKDINNNLHCLDDAQFAYLLPDGSVEITEQEADDIIASNQPAPEPKTKFSAREFLRRLTLDEKIALKTSDDIQAQIWYDELIAADFVDIEDPDVEDAIDYGIFKGIFTEQRKSELLTPEQQ